MSRVVIEGQGQAMTWEQVVELGKTNPYWTKEENDAADARRPW